MDESGNKQQQQPFGNGQQRHQHSRPFFYVQPPSQPYYLYQHWQLNHPYSHYGLPAGFNMGRPCMLPYQYMQYPGFMYPQAPIYPMDYRRMFEPRFQAAGPPYGDAPRHQQQHQGQGRRETACSEAQTDPSDALTKLIECLDKLRAGEPQPGEARGRELDSGIASQSSAMFSPEEEKKPEGQKPTTSESRLEVPAVTCRDSRAAAAASTSTPDGCWSAGLEEEPPIDSSSLQEDCPEPERPEGDGRFGHFEEDAAADVQLDVTVTLVPAGDAGASTPPLPSSSAQAEAGGGVAVPEDELLGASLDEDGPGRGYRILKLPLDSVLSPGPAGAACLSSPNAAYYYNYLSMQTNQERMSVLSPSLDELSSRDEMFSTDLDDMDIFPGHVYAGPPHRPPAEAGDGWPPGWKRVTCACCGKRLARGTSRRKAHGPKTYRDEAGDTEEDEEDEEEEDGCQQPVRKHLSARKAHGGPARRAPTPWFGRSEPAEQDEGRDVPAQGTADGETASAEPQRRTCRDGPCRDDPTATEPSSRRTDGDSASRRRQTTASLQRQEPSGQWKVMYHRPRDEDDDAPPPIHWERVPAARGESR